jgi:hypothetical protein
MILGLCPHYPRSFKAGVTILVPANKSDLKVTHSFAFARFTPTFLAFALLTPVESCLCFNFLTSLLDDAGGVLSLPDRDEHSGSTPTKENEIYVAVSDVTTEDRVVTLDACGSSDTMVQNDAYDVNTGPPDVVTNNSAYGIVTGPMTNNTLGAPDVMAKNSAYGMTTGPPDVMTNNSAYGVSGLTPNFMTKASAYGGTSSTIAHVMNQNDVNTGPTGDMSAAIYNTENEVGTIV